MLDTKTTMHQTKNTLPAEAREKIIDALQARLYDATDLYTQTRQAHWNVKGPSFIGLHELFEQVYTDLEGHIDTMAERIVILGGTALGTVRATADNSSLPEYPHDIFSGKAHVDALAERLADFGGKVRKAIDVADQAGDQDTADLFTEVSRAVDKSTWFIEAHIQADA